MEKEQLNKQNEILLKAKESIYKREFLNYINLRKKKFPKF